MQLNFHQHPFITPPSYLGKPVTTTCHRGDQGDCVSGCLFFSQKFPFGSEEAVVGMEIQVSGRYQGSHFTMFLDLDKETIESIETAFKKRLKSMSTDRCYQAWLETLIPHTQPRPSEKAFLIILQGFGDQYECSPMKDTYPNVRAPKFDRGFWTERWPTLEEAQSMVASLDSAVFGVPAKWHYHGN